VPSSAWRCLAALVNAHLTSDLTVRLKVLQIPANFISIVITAVETGTVPSGVGGGSIEDRVIEAAYPRVPKRPSRGAHHRWARHVDAGLGRGPHARPFGRCGA